MPLLKKFMRCAELRTGAVIIGWLGLTFSVISLGGCSAALAEVIGSERHNYYEAKFVSANKEWISVMMTCIGITVLANILLVWGAIAKNRFLLLPWLTITMLSFFWHIYTFISDGARMANSGGDKGAAAGIFISGVLVTGIVLYLWICIESFFRELREESLEKEEQDIALFHNLEVN